MADYEARRGNSGSPEEEKARADQNNAKNLRNAADVAMATKNPYAMAAGAAVKTADKVTGGKSTEALGKAMTQANKISPAGKQMQNLSNKLAESGASDKIGKAASLYNSAQGKGADAGGNAAGNAASGAASGANAASGGPTPNQVKNKKTSGGEQDSSLPSSGENKNKNNPPSAGGLGNKMGEKEEKEDKSDSSSSSQQEEKKDSIFSFFALSPLKVMAFGALSSGLLIVLMILVAASVVSDIFGDYEDGIGMSATLNDETGNTTFRASTPEQQEFYDRVAEVKNEYQSNGKTVDALKVVSVYHVLKSNGADVSYEKMSKSDIEEIADAMFDDNNSYSEEIFKSNLKNSIFPKYISGLSDGKKEDMADEVIDYVERYKKLVARDTGSTCSGGGNCSYDIKGFYIGDRGNVTESLQISNLYVRLMQCGGQYGGTWGQPMAGEDLVEFENYILGVAYQEIGPSAPAEAFKAQMVAARSYSFARHVVMGGWHTLKEEDGKWVMQMASCTADQVYCNPDQGCSSSGGNGQSGQVHSGTTSGRFMKGPIAEDSPLRTYAAETEGEVLVNSSGYVISSNYVDDISNKFSELANSGLNYKQILLQVYNNGSHNYGASDIQKASCGGGNSTNCSSTGPYASWKQYEGEWVDVPMGDSGKTIKQIGCLATSIAIQIARSGVETNVSGEFNPGTFVQYLNSHGGFASGGNFIWDSATSVAPKFKYAGDEWTSGWSKQEKLNKIKELTSQDGVYVVAEVKGNTGQHWVAIDNVNGDTVNMMDPGSTSTDLWGQYDWNNTSRLVYYKVG